MKKLFVLGLVSAMPVSATPIVTSPFVVQSASAMPKWVNSYVAVGGYAYNLRQARCCTIFRVTGVEQSGTAYPVYTVVFYSDTSGDWPVSSDYWRGHEMRFNSFDLQGVTMS